MKLFPSTRARLAAASVFATAAVLISVAFALWFNATTMFVSMTLSLPLLGLALALYLSVVLQTLWEHKIL